MHPDWVPLTQLSVLAKYVRIGVTTMLSGCVALMLFASVTSTVKSLALSTVGVPVIAPELALSDRPSGKLPELIDQL
jgi:hypothetical protein